MSTRERLERALNRGDFSLSAAQREVAPDHLDCRLPRRLGPSNNFPESNHARTVRLDYQAKLAAANAAAMLPDKPREAQDVPDLKADELSEDQLPTILHGTRDPKVDGPLAPEPDPSDSEEDDPIFEGRTLSAENPAGRIARKKTTTTKKTRKKKKTLASEAQLDADLENADDLSDNEFIDDDFEGSGDESEEEEPMEEDSGDESSNTECAL